MYLGQSLDHHNRVGKILSFQTGFVSPQFHCVYNELFTSCFGTVTDTVFDKEHWDSMLQFSGEHTSHMDPVSPDPARREQIARIQQDLFDIFRHPDHVTPPPPTVPEGDGPFLPLQIGGDEGTSDDEGDARDDSLRELQQMRERPTALTKPIPCAVKQPAESPRPAQRRGIRFVDKLDQRVMQPAQQSTRQALAPERRRSVDSPH